MITTSRRVRGAVLSAVTLAAAGAVASCASGTPPQPVQASNPTVTYNYRTDQELLQANRNAVNYCAQFQTVPRTGNISSNPDGSKAIVFECVRTTPATAPPAKPTVSYTYRTDAELVQASQAAGAHCQPFGAPPITAGIVNNPNGTKTVTFQCGQ